MTFSSFECDSILSISLIIRKPLDVLYWDLEKYGCYSVCSACRTMRAHLVHDMLIEGYGIPFGAPTFFRGSKFSSCRLIIRFVIPILKEECGLCGAPYECYQHALIGFVSAASI